MAKTVVERVQAYRERKAAEKQQQIEIYLPQSLLRRIDREAKKEVLSRSQVITNRLKASWKPVKKQPQATSPVTSNIRAKGDMELKEFAKLVQVAADKTTGKGRFGPRKVFIAAAWRRLKLPGLDETNYKAKLIEAHRAGLLVLHRADLVGAMDPKLVAASEVQYLNATFHFIESKQT